MRKILFFILLNAVSMTLSAWENQDWLIEYDWHIEDGRDFVYPRAEHIYWIRSPSGEFKKFAVPSDNTLYRRRLREEHFYYLYQSPDQKDKITYVGNIAGGEALEVDLRNNNMQLFASNKHGLYIAGDRNGEQQDIDHPIVGIWGKLPSLGEIRLVPPDNYIYYLNIDNEIPGWGVRSGTYLFKQTGDKTFESDTSFPDGHVRLEIFNREFLVLTPLFTLPDSKLMTEPLLFRRGAKKQ